MPGVVEFSKKHLRLPILAGPENITTIIDRVDDPSFATAAGLVLWGNKYSSCSAAHFGDVVKNIMSNQTVAKVQEVVEIVFTITIILLQNTLSDEALCEVEIKCGNVKSSLP